MDTPVSEIRGSAPIAKVAASRGELGYELGYEEVGGPGGGEKNHTPVEKHARRNLAIDKTRTTASKVSFVCEIF